MVIPRTCNPIVEVSGFRCGFDPQGILMVVAPGASRRPQMDDGVVATKLFVERRPN
jgi:hypothetical protein